MTGTAAEAPGHGMLTVARPPAVAIIPTGEEIRPIGSVLGPGEVTDSNSVLLAARATEVGARPVLSEVQPDDPAVIAAAVRRAARAADLVLILAGSSAGRRDHAAAALGMAGGLTVRGVAPGSPVTGRYRSARRSSSAVSESACGRSPAHCPDAAHAVWRAGGATRTAGG